MKTIKIAHLYYDLMNLYGEQGNILALKKAIENQNVKTSIDYITKDDKMDLAKYDIIYIGSGSEDNLEIVRQDILNHKKVFSNIFKDKVIIATGNALELFGKKIDDKEALGLLDYSSTLINKRISAEVVYEASFLDSPIIGFQNRGSIVTIKNKHLFKVIEGPSDDTKSCFEGIKSNNFYGTYTIGPLLIRNPHLTDYIIHHLFDDLDIPYEPKKDTSDYKAYNAFIHSAGIKDS